MSSDGYAKINGSSLSTSSPPPSTSNIRVFVRWQDQVVFSGEEIKCTITFKNTARPPQPAGHRPYQLATSSSSRHANADGRPRQPSPLSPVATQHRGKGNSGLAPPASARGHRSTLSLTVPSTASRARAGSGSLPWSPATARPSRSGSNGGDNQNGGSGHKRSVSIVSIGSVSTVDDGGQGSSSGKSKPQRPARGHARASSLQIAPRGTALSGPRSGL